MHFGRQVATYVLVLMLLLGAACNKKKPQLPVQAHAPTLSVPVPEQIPEAQPPPEQPSTTATEEPPPEPPKPKTKRTHTAPKKAVPAANAQNSSTAPGTGNTTIAAARPPATPAAEPTPDMAIGADVSSAQLSQQKQTTLQMLDATEKNLKSLPRNLSHDEEAMVAQIKSYVGQSRKATSDGDFERAYNLATKARLLSDALLKK